MTHPTISLRNVSRCALFALFALTSNVVACGGYITRANDSERAERTADDSNGKPDIIAGSGIGRVTFGMTALQVTEVIGEPDETATVSEGASYGLYHATGISILYRAGRATVIHAYSGRGAATRQRFRPYVGSTKEGVTVNSTRAQVLAKLGTPGKQSADSLTFGTSTTGIVRVNFVAGGAGEIESIELWAPGMEA